MPCTGGKLNGVSMDMRSTINEVCDKHSKFKTVTSGRRATGRHATGNAVDLGVTEEWRSANINPPEDPLNQELRSILYDVAQRTGRTFSVIHEVKGRKSHPYYVINRNGIEFQGETANRTPAGATGAHTHIDYLDTPEVQKRVIRKMPKGGGADQAPLPVTPPPTKSASQAPLEGNRGVRKMPNADRMKPLIVPQREVEPDVEDDENPSSQRFGKDRYYRTTANLNIRSAPGLSGERMGRPILNGCPVKALADAVDGWMRVMEISGGRVGYVNVEYLEEAE